MKPDFIDETSQYLYCRFCKKYRTLKWFIDDNGYLNTIGQAMKRVELHVQRAHPEQYEKIEKKVDHIYETIPFEYYDEGNLY
jgi:hypothetical protein